MRERDSEMRLFARLVGRSREDQVRSEAEGGSEARENQERLFWGGAGKRGD